jgi:hypothetical protein
LNRTRHGCLREKWQSGCSLLARRVICTMLAGYFQYSTNRNRNSEDCALINLSRTATITLRQQRAILIALLARAVSARAKSVQLGGFIATLHV